MSARPPRASTKSDAKAETKPEPRARAEAKPPIKRAKTRGATHADREKTDRRAPSLVPTDRYEKIGDDDVLEVADLPDALDRRGAPLLRMLVLEAPPHLAAAQGAIAAAGHTVVVGAAGRDALDKVRFAIGEVDAMLVGMPGGEPLLDLAIAAAHRPVVIAAWTASALEAARRSAEIGADLATVRPHDIERLAPILLAAGRLVEHRRMLGALRAGAPAAVNGDAALDSALDAALDQGNDPGDDPGNGPGNDPGNGPDANGADPSAAGAVDVDIDIDVDDIGADLDLDGDGDAEPGGLMTAERFAQAAAGEVERARASGAPLAVAMFMVDIPQPPPPPGLRGILRARAGNALVHALRTVDLATELDQDRFLVVMPDIDRTAAAELARRLISAVAAGDPVTAAGRTFPPKVIGAVSGAAAGDALDLPRLVQDATQLLESAQVTGASLAVET